MHTTFATQAKTSLISVLVLTGLVIAALSGTVVAGVSLLFGFAPQTWQVGYGGVAGFLALLGVQLVYLGFAAQLVRTRVVADASGSMIHSHFASDHASEAGAREDALNGCHAAIENQPGATCKVHTH